MTPLAQLEDAVAADPDRAHALCQAFVAEQDVPLRDGGRATFVYFDGQATDAVFLVHWVFGLESRQELTRLPHSQLFYLDLDLPRAARVEYKFEVVRGGNRAWLHDPNNHLRAFDPFGSNSVCTMPRYQEPAWVRSDPLARRGRLESFVLHSRSYGDDRTVVVYLPHEYRPDKVYPLVICHDGSDYRKFAGIETVLDNLIHRHEVKPLIVAFTDGVQRNVEYGADPRQPEFLVDDLLPALEARYPISPDVDERGLMGASFGAVSSAFCAWSRPGVFGRLMLQSGSFVFTDVGGHGRSELWDPVVAFVNQWRTDPGRLDARLFMSCGRFESLISYNRALLPPLRRSGLRVRFTESDDGHNWICWRDQLRAGLTWLFPGHLWMVYD